MTTLIETLNVDGSKLWFASSPPTAFLSTDLAPGVQFQPGDLVQVLGPGNTFARFWVCTTGGAPGTAVFKAFSAGETGSGSLTIFPFGGLVVPAYSSTFGTPEPGVSQQLFVNAVFIPYACTLTGLQVAVNANSGTDKGIVALYDGAGTALLANSATAGITIVGASPAGIQKFAFTAPVNVAGPALHFITFETNGTTGEVLTQIAGVMPAGIIASGVAFGTVPASITPPTGFTTLQGPIGSTY